MSDGVQITIDEREYRIPDDLDLNDVAALEDEGYALESIQSAKAVRFVVWRLIRRHEPDITIEEAGAKVPLSLLTGKAEEGPPPIPLPVPEAPSGLSSVEASGNGSAGTTADAGIHEVSGSP